MIQSVGAGQAPFNVYAAQAKQNVRPAGVPFGAVKGTPIDRKELFTPTELKTLENVKEHARKQGMSERNVEVLDAVIINGKFAEKTVSHDISIKEIIGGQIRGIQTGDLDASPRFLQALQNIYDNFQLLQGAELFA